MGSLLAASPECLLTDYSYTLSRTGHRVRPGSFRVNVAKGRFRRKRYGVREVRSSGRARPGGPQAAGRLNTSEALVPPKPKELESTVSMLRFLASCGTRSMAVATEGLSRLSVGGATLSRIASTEKIASTAPAAPSRWPVADLVDDMASVPAALPNSRSTAPSSISSPIGVDVPCAFTYWTSLAEMPARARAADMHR